MNKIILTIIFLLLTAQHVSAEAMGSRPEDQSQQVPPQQQDQTAQTPSGVTVQQPHPSQVGLWYNTTSDEIYIYKNAVDSITTSEDTEKWTIKLQVKESQEAATQQQAGQVIPDGESALSQQTKGTSTTTSSPA